jgi:hypothetical protein
MNETKPSPPLPAFIFTFLLSTKNCDLNKRKYFEKELFQKKVLKPLTINLSPLALVIFFGLTVFLRPSVEIGLVQ